MTNLLNTIFKVLAFLCCLSITGAAAVYINAHHGIDFVVSTALVVLIGVLFAGLFISILQD